MGLNARIAEKVARGIAEKRPAASTPFKCVVRSGECCPSRRDNTTSVVHRVFGHCGGNRGRGTVTESLKLEKVGAEFKGVPSGQFIRCVLRGPICVKGLH